MQDLLVRYDQTVGKDGPLDVKGIVTVTFFLQNGLQIEGRTQSQFQKKVHFPAAGSFPG